MSTCCATDVAGAGPCPRCGEIGPVVGVATVRPHLGGAVDGDWQHCPTPDCPVVYHLGSDGGPVTVTVADVITQVGHKAPARPRPVCFCFAHTADNLAADLHAHDGVSTVKAFIRTAVAGGLCACEHLNPAGVCCLPEIRHSLEAIVAASSV